MLNEADLIFIISQPRSGSTLLQSIVSNNKFVNTASEPWLLFHFLSYFNPHLVDAKYSNSLAYKGTKDFFEKVNFQEEIKGEIRNFVSRIYQKTLGQREGVKYILDKTPRYYEIIDSIREVFPTAKIIVLKRNPLAVLNSIIDTWKLKGLNHLYPYRRDVLLAPLMLQNFIEKSSSDPDVLVSSYEALTDNPASESKRIYQWLDIEFEEAYLDYSKNKKFKGKYGDPVGIHQSSRPVKRAENWLSKLKDSYWKDFFVGYNFYLGSDFLQEYGYTNSEVDRESTKIFKTFQFIDEQAIPDRPPIERYLRHLHYRSAYKLYSK